MNNTTNTLRALSASDLFGLWVGLATGNFFYQVCASQHWSIAGERSFFEFVALLAVWVCCKLKPNASDQTREEEAS